MLKRSFYALLFLTLAGCASEPDVEESLKAGETSGKLVIVGKHGPLSPRQIQRVFARMGPEREDMLQRHLAVESVVADTPLVYGNRTMLLIDGPASFRAIFAAIRAARQSVNLEYFILEDVAIDGEQLGDLLVKKRGEGVKINIIYDSYGSQDTPAAFFDRLREAGVALVQFNPLNPLDSLGRPYLPNERDHRKILVADGQTAIVGGVNLSHSYTSLSSGSISPEDRPPLYWRDTDLLIEGPVVAQLQSLFLAHWRAQDGPSLDQASFFPEISERGTEVIRIIGSSPDSGKPLYYATVLSAIRSAKQRIWLNTAYFVPTHREMEDLEDAARRGVDVRILAPDESDSDLAVAVQHSRYDDLLEAGVQIYETHDEFLHSKSMSVDGVWSVIGSSNFDHRSVLFNDEVDAVILGGRTAEQLEAKFRDDIAKARPVDASRWRDRPLDEKIRELIARIWQAML